MERIKLIGVVVIIVGVVCAGFMLDGMLPTIGDTQSPANS